MSDFENIKEDVVQNNKEDQDWADLLSLRAGNFYSALV